MTFPNRGRDPVALPSRLPVARGGSADDAPKPSVFSLFAPSLTAFEGIYENWHIAEISVKYTADTTCARPTKFAKMPNKPRFLQKIHQKALHYNSFQYETRANPAAAEVRSNCPPATPKHLANAEKRRKKAGFSSPPCATSAPPQHCRPFTHNITMCRCVCVGRRHAASSGGHRERFLAEAKGNHHCRGGRCPPPESSTPAAATGSRLYFFSPAGFGRIGESQPARSAGFTPLTKPPKLNVTG